MNKLCVVMFINEKYQGYVPIFAHSSFLSYPEYDVAILMQGKMKKEISQVLNKVSSRWNLVIKEGMFKEFSSHDQYFKSLRWTYYDDIFSKYDNIYIGDIDTIVCKECPTLLDQHLYDCDCKGLPYSNVVRVGSKRLVGRHFMKSEYFNKMLPVMNKYLHIIKNKSIKLEDNIRGNEWILYKMIRESGIGFCKEKTSKENLVSTHHGIHLGLWRGVSRNPSNDASVDLHRSYFQQYNEMKKDELFKEIISVINLGELPKMEKSYLKFLK